jgi:flagellar hook-associated protein 2
MGGISSFGGNSIDAASIARQLAAADRASPDRRLREAEATVTTKLSAYGTLKGQLAEFVTAMEGLKGLTVGRTANPTNTDALTVKASDEAQEGSFSVEVRQLAQSASIASDAFASREEVLGVGTVTISVGAEAPVEIAMENGGNTLEDLQNAINASGLAVEASIINDGVGERLILAGTQTGAAETITVTVTPAPGNSGNAGAPGGSSGPDLSRLDTFTSLITPQDAEISVNGLTVSRPTNQFSDVLEGITFTLKAETSTPQTVSIATDTGASKKALDAFIEAYNALSETISKNTAFNQDTGAKGPLLGESTLRSLQSALSSTLLVQSNGPGFNSLVELGVKTDATGRITRSADELEAAIEADPESVNAFFASLSDRMESTIDRFDGRDSLVAARIAGLEGRLEAIDDQKERLNLRMARIEARYFREFSALDSLLAGMNQTRSFLSAQLSGGSVG